LGGEGGGRIEGEGGRGNLRSSCRPIRQDYLERLNIVASVKKGGKGEKKGEGGKVKLNDCIPLDKFGGRGGKEERKEEGRKNKHHRAVNWKIRFASIG